MNKEQIKEMEERDAAGFARVPSQAAEFEEWEGEQVWLDQMLFGNKIIAE